MLWKLTSYGHVPFFQLQCIKRNKLTCFASASGTAAVTEHELRQRTRIIAISWQLQQNKVLYFCRQTVPFLLQATKQGFQDLGAKDLESAHELLKSGQMRLECRTGSAQTEGGVHDMHSFDKVRW